MDRLTTATNTACQSAGMVRRTPRDPVETLGHQMQTLLSKSGYMTLDQAQRLAGVEHRAREFDHSLFRKSLFEGCGVFQRYIFADLDDVSFVRDRSPESIADYTAARDDLARLIEIPQLLILRGGNGSGKTHLASALVHKFCDLGRPAHYTTTADFFIELKSTFGAPGRTQMDLIGRYRAYELLVLDEIEVRSDSTWENNVLRSLVDSRYASDVATVIITNKTTDELQNYFSNAIRDRVCESGSVISCEWKSLRTPRSTR